MTRADLYSLVLGAATTLSLSLIGIVFGVALGLALALIRISRLRGIGWAAGGYVSIVRATPLITLALLIFFIVPAGGFDISATAAAALALTLNTSAFNSEIWRAGLESFPRDQVDAAKAVGMQAGLRFRRIVLPQVARRSLPALVNEMTILVKNSPAIAVLGVVDITRAAIRIGAETYRPLPPLIVALLLYTAIVLLLVMSQRWIERRVRLAEELA